jgi:predicted Rossmann fold flavoprotein
MQKTNYDAIIIGAGAAGLMCAIEAGKRGRSVLLLDHSAKPAEKIRISGGGRCNFTNLNTTPENFISNNPRFAVSALKRYTQFDFINLVKKHKIKYHEKNLGQLFCDDSAMQIINMLLDECHAAGVKIQLSTTINNISKNADESFSVLTSKGDFLSSSVVIATGGKSIPKMGASGFGYDVAQKFGLKIISTNPALVPFIFEGEQLNATKALAGISIDVVASCAVKNGKKPQTKQFAEGMLFTHRGLSGPAVLQISSYWNEGKNVAINLLPKLNVFEFLKSERQNHPKQEIVTILSKILPRRLAETLADNFCTKNLAQQKFTPKMADLSNATLQILANCINNWQFIPNGTEGYRTAEVTLGGVDTDELSSTTFEAKKAKGLFFIGEVVDVTGWLGGYNFQWAWASGYACGQYV